MIRAAGRHIAVLGLTQLACAVVASACTPQVNLGNAVLWSARHETGDLTEWAEAGKGGTEADAPDTSLAISSDVAHSGRYAVKLTNGAVATYEAAHLWRQDDYPTSAYYSAWFFLPRTYQTSADWSIMQFEVPVAASDAGTLSLQLDIDLRSLPTGDLILSVYDHRQAYLRSPTPDPAILVPIGRWFQVEALYRNAPDDTGEVIVWLDGQMNYDLHRPFGGNTAVYWTVGSKTEGLSPAESVIYMDDAAVSLVRVTPTGTL